MVTVKIPQALRGHTGGAATVSVEGATVRDVLGALIGVYPALGGRILDGPDKVRRFVNVFVGEDDIRHSDGLDTVVPEGKIVSILPAVAGGADPLVIPISIPQRFHRSPAPVAHSGHPKRARMGSCPTRTTE